MFSTTFAEFDASKKFFSAKAIFIFIIFANAFSGAIFKRDASNVLSFLFAFNACFKILTTSAYSKSGIEFTFCEIIRASFV